MTGLNPTTTYHVRVRAKNFTGVSVGPDYTVTTSNLPSLSAISVSAITASSARLSAEITPNFAPTTYRFLYGATASYASMTAESDSIGEDQSPHEVSILLTGLAPERTYHYALAARNSDGETISPDQSFSTAVPESQHGTTHERPHCKRPRTLRHRECVTLHRQTASS